MTLNDFWFHLNVQHKTLRVGQSFAAWCFSLPTGSGKKISTDKTKEQMLFVHSVGMEYSWHELSTFNSIVVFSVHSNPSLATNWNHFWETAFGMCDFALTSFNYCESLLFLICQLSTDGTHDAFFVARKTKSKMEWTKKWQLMND